MIAYYYSGFANIYYESDALMICVSWTSATYYHDLSAPDILILYTIC